MIFPSRSKLLPPLRRAWTGLRNSLAPSEPDSLFFFFFFFPLSRRERKRGSGGGTFHASIRSRKRRRRCAYRRALAINIGYDELASTPSVTSEAGPGPSGDGSLAMNIGRSSWPFSTPRDGWDDPEHRRASLSSINQWSSGPFLSLPFYFISLFSFFSLSVLPFDRFCSCLSRRRIFSSDTLLRPRNGASLGSSHHQSIIFTSHIYFFCFRMTKRVSRRNL